MSREGVMIAARDRARRLQAMLGENAPVLLGCALVVLHEAPRQAVATTTTLPAANEQAPGPGAGAGAADRSAAAQVR